MSAPRLLPAQDWRAGTGRLDGKVMDAAGQPLSGASVKLELPGRGGISLRSDSKGKWAILGLTGGDWEVEVSADGYLSRRVTLSVTEQSRRPTLEVRLDRAATTAVSPEVADALASAEAAEREGRLAEARAEYENYRRGLAYLQLGRTEECRADLARVLELAPATPQGEMARKALAQVH